jgi:hypothetical protein
LPIPVKERPPPPPLPPHLIILNLKLGTKCEPQNAVFPKKIELISKSI